jgi:hypothetical protein
MRLYTPGVSTDYSRYVIDHGFVGLPRATYDSEELDAATRNTPEGELTPYEKPFEPTDVAEYCEFRDMPPGGLALSRTTEAEVEQTGVIEPNMTIEGGPRLLDDPGDVVLSIEVPDSVALANEFHHEPPSGQPFREFWLTPGEANRYRDTLEIIHSNDGEEPREDLPGVGYVPSQAPVPDGPQPEIGTAHSPSSARRSRRRRRRSQRKRDRRKGNGQARPGTEEESADSVKAVLRERLEDDPEGARDELRPKVAELGYELAYAGRTFMAPVTKRTYHIIDPEKRERIDAFGNGTLELTLLEVSVWSEQALKKRNASEGNGHRGVTGAS